MSMPIESARLTKAARKYLAHYAEPEAALATVLAKSGAPYPAVVVIPAFGEDDLLRKTLASVPRCCDEKTLVVLVVNRRDPCPGWADAANRRTLARLRASASNRPRGPSLASNVNLLVFPDFDMILIDRTRPGQRLPKRQGVGLARKIGADFAMALWAVGGCNSPWIHCTDADVSLPQDYFDRPSVRFPGDSAQPNRAVPSALLFDFRHIARPPPDAGKAILEYEIYLRYYVLGLRSARSPYAFHSIGSTLAIHANAYAQVRGFPKREAAEDFHVLAKLAKVGPIRTLPGPPILISDRESERVPFGTGHAVLAAQARSSRGEPFPAFDPRIFAWLGVWLDTLESIAKHPATPIAHWLAVHAQPTDVDPTRLKRLLDSTGAREAAEKALRNSGNPSRSLNENFDALATLKLIHALRDQVYPAIPLEDALNRASFINLDTGTTLEEQRAALANLELDKRD